MDIIVGAKSATLPKRFTTVAVVHSQALHIKALRESILSASRTHTGRFYGNRHQYPMFLMS